ncbi:MAG TPA: MFS transporter, partial [Candidatus Binataceae bacterium]|nr:MFS transporter [Candidatus Binataceae bacterium]
GAAGLVVAAQGHSLSYLVVGYVVVGAGVALAGATPTAVVAVNWFPHRRGTAVAIAMLGLGIGMAVAPLLITGVVAGMGWRAGMAAVAAPMALLAAPVALLMVRSGPRADGEMAARYPDHHTVEEGLEVVAALGRARFWLLAAVALCGEAACGGVFYHMIPYLIGAGYRPEAAASVMGAQAVLVTVGALIAGGLADYFGPRPVLSLSWLVLAVAVMLLIGARDVSWGIWALAGFIALWGLGMGNFSAMAPLVANALGMRRFSAFMGVTTMCWFFGQGLGPPLAGVLFDRTGGYVVPLEVAIGLLIMSAVLTRLVAAPMGEEVPASIAKAI